MGYEGFNLVKEKMEDGKGFIFGGDEDLGMIGIEGEGCGSGVIGYGDGG